MATLVFYAQFIASKVGANGLTVTWDVEQITRSDGSRSALVTGGATNVTIGRRGLYGYRLENADLSLYDYVATAITAGTADQQEVAALGLVVPDALISSRLAAAGYSAPLDAAGVRGAVGLASANLDTQLAGLPTDQDVRDALKLAPSAGAAAAGSVDAHLDDLLTAAAGGGATAQPYTVYQADGVTPEPGVLCWLTTDLGGSSIVSSGTSNALGVVTFYHDLAAGTTVYVWRYKAGIDYANPDTEVIP